MTDTAKDGRDDGGWFDRRKFLAGIGAVGAGGAAGCLSGDGSGSPTGTPDGTTAPPGQQPDPTETPGGTPTATPTPDPVRAFEPLPANLTYEYYEGEFSSMPNFGDMSPTETGEADLMTSDPADGPGALRYTGTIPVGDRLPTGSYTILTGPELVSNDRLRVYVNGTELPLSGEGNTLFLDSGDNTLRVEYYQTSADSAISLGWRGIYDELLPPIAETDPVRRGKQQYIYELNARGRSQGKMMQMANSGSEHSQRSIAVALPTYTNYCFDMNNCSVKYAWRGAFLDYGPLSSYGGAAGDEAGQPLGVKYDVGGVEHALRIGDPDATPETEFLAFRESPYPAELHYTVDGTRVTQAVEGFLDSLGLKYSFEFDSAPADPVYFHTADNDNLERSASAGTWNGPTLEVPGGTGSFTVSVINGRVSR